VQTLWQVQWKLPPKESKRREGKPHKLPIKFRLTTRCSRRRHDC
jgi:hypothetical protein